MKKNFYPIRPARSLPQVLSRIRIRRFLLFWILLGTVQAASAQAPTSLQYPTPNGFIANLNNVYLAPTLAGSTNGLTYSINSAAYGPNAMSPGLSFNTGTGLISGVPTAASNLTNYVVTATNTFGSTNYGLSITVTSGFFNNAYDSVFFRLEDTVQKVGTGINAGDIILYDSVRVIDGQAIDCIVKTRSFTTGTTFLAYDQPLVTDGSTYNSNNPRYFSPQVTFPAGGGSIIYDFQFIAHGTYNTVTGDGTSVTLQNVQLNTYDIDGNGNTGSNQYNNFNGFDTSELSSASTIRPAVFDPGIGLTKFESNVTSNNLTVTADATRVRNTYRNMSSFSAQVGAGSNGNAYFFLDFSSGPNFSTAVKSTPPSVDLNLALPGTGNGVSGCANSLSFTAPSQTNAAASGTPLRALTVRYENTLANLPDGTGEQLLLSGFTAGTGNYPLNFSTGGSSSVTVGGVAYTVTRSVSGTTNTIVFTTASTFSLAQAETLLDVLQYTDTASNPTNGARRFIVNIRDSQFVSPDAVFTPSLNCVSISGNIFHDANGLSDGIVNASGSVMGQFATAGAYAVLTNPTTDAVIRTVPISAGGAYAFGRTDPETYNVFVSNTATPGATVSAAAYPTNYRNTGENLGAAAGTDGLIDGKLTLTVGTVPVTNANFGIQIPPVVLDSILTNRANPGGFNFFTVPAAAFRATDADGTVDSLVVMAFPAGANYLRVGTTLYVNGGTCPPQSACVAWPGSLRLPFSSAGTIAVDPTSAGNSTVSLSYTVIDNGRFGSNNGLPGTINIPFTVPGTPITITGNVWNDANGNGIKAATESYSAAASTGQTLYAMLIQTTNTYSAAPTIYAATAVTAADTGFLFTDVPSGNDYEMRIVSRTAAPVAGDSLNSISSALATGYTGVSTNNGGTINANQNTDNLVNILGTITANKAGVSFGIERIPSTDAKAFTAPAGGFTPSGTVLIGGMPGYGIAGNSSSLSGPAQKSLSGTDPEDCPAASSCNTGRSYRIQTVKANTRVYYDFGSGSVPVLAGTLIPNFDPANMAIYGQAGEGYTAANALGFTYSLVDDAGVGSPAATYSLETSNAPLLISLVKFTGSVTDCNAHLYWESAGESAGSRYAVEQSGDGKSFKAVKEVEGSNNGAGGSYSAAVPMQQRVSYFRLKLADHSGAPAYSQVLRLQSQPCGTGGVVFFPNPAASTIRLSGLQSTATVAISDLSGKTVVSFNEVANGQALDIRSLTAGIYTIRVTDGANNVSYLKLIRE